jgi:predicted nucleotidyltransferase
MGTEANLLTAALFGKTRRALLGVLYGHPDEAFYLRQLVRAARAGQGAVQREVKKLSEAGIIRRTVQGREVYYRANPECPVFPELKSLVVKTAGVGDVLRSALASLAGKIKVAFIFGSFAQGKQNQRSDVDIVVIGEATFEEVVDALASAQETLAREVQPTVYPAAEFQARVKAREHFVTSVLGESKIFLIGDERELARLAQERLGHGTQKQRARA